MKQTFTGWIMLAASMGTMCTLLAGDISNLKSWSDTLYPAFIGGVIAHLGAVLMAFAGGKLIPTEVETKE